MPRGRENGFVIHRPPGRRPRRAPPGRRQPAPARARPRPGGPAV